MAEASRALLEKLIAAIGDQAGRGKAVTDEDIAGRLERAADCGFVCAPR